MLSLFGPTDHGLTSKHMKGSNVRVCQARYNVGFLYIFIQRIYMLFFVIETHPLVYTLFYHYKKNNCDDRSNQ